MATYVERTREVVAAEDDDYFQADTILYYLNKSLRKVVSYMVLHEQESSKSLRALDNLRRYKDISVNGLDFIDRDNYYAVEVPFPVTPGEQINQFTFLKYGQRTVLRELTQNNLVKLEWGNLRPSQFESYYYVTRNNSDDTVFEVYLSSDDSSTDNKVRVYYILNPTDLKLTDEKLPDLPEQLENAVIYGAATMMVMQESVKDPQTQAPLFNQLYQEELQASSY